MQPNRLERVWKFLQPEILNRWNKLSEDDLTACQYQFDLIIEIIRKTYFPGRSHLTLEGEIRDWMSERISFHENAEQ